MKKANKGSSDACLALLGYRNTPAQGLDTSPVQRLKSRRTKTLLPHHYQTVATADTRRTTRENAVKPRTTGE